MVLTSLAALGYLLAFIVSLLPLLKASDHSNQPPIRLVGLMLVTLAFHGILWFQLNHHLEFHYNLTLTASISLFLLVLNILWLICLFFRPLLALGTFCLPIALLVLLFDSLYPSRELYFQFSQIAFWHMVMALLSFSFITLAALQTILWYIQNLRLRRHHGLTVGGMFTAIETMERIVSEFMLLGFVFLTGTMLSGALFSNQLFGRSFVFNHHIILAVVAWFCFLVILTGRHLFGWKGQWVMHWTFAGFITLILSYFGVRFVVDVVL